jgi:hypothetical protein
MIRYFTLALFLHILLRLVKIFSSQANWDWSTQNIVFMTIFKLLRSNHSRRTFGNSTLLKFNLKNVLKLKVIKYHLNDELYSYTPLLLDRNSKAASDIFFVGDSHTEFFSRTSSSSADAISIRTHGVWLGPKTLTGIYFDGSTELQVAKIIEYINVVHNGSWKKIPSLCAISIGNIDIRCFFHQALIFGLVKDEVKLLEVFRTAAKIFLKQTARAIKIHFPHMGFGVVEVLFCNNDEGYSGDDRKFIRNLLKKGSFPTLGSIEERIKWTNQVNQIYREICQENNFLYIETNRFLGSSNIRQVLSPEVSIDGAHLTSLSVLSEIQHNAHSQILSGIE